MKKKVYVCEKCNGQVSDSARFCNHCGSQFDAHKKTGYGVKYLMNAGISQEKALAIMSYHGSLGAVRSVKDTKGLLKYKFLKEHLSEEDAQKVVDFLTSKKLVAKSYKDALDAKKYKSKKKRSDEEEIEEVAEASYEVGEEVVVEDEGEAVEAVVTEVYEGEEGEVVYTVETETGEELEVTEEDIEPEEAIGDAASFNYYYDGTPITKEAFEKAVPSDWEKKVKGGEFSWGYYRAIERD